MFRKLVPVLLLATAACAAEFDAVSIKHSRPGVRGSGYNLTRGRLQGKNQTLRDLVEIAWDLQNYQLSGGPGWAGSDRFETTATFSAETTESECRQMLQTMLADRFALTFHRESKRVAGYALTAGRSGVKFSPTSSDQASMMMGPAPDPGPRRLTATSGDMPGLARLLARLLRQPVEDKTTLTGKYDFSMDWTPDETQVSSPASDKQQTPVPAESAAGPSLFTAIQGLGLVLKPQRVTIEILVIDHAAQPTEN